MDSLVAAGGASMGARRHALHRSCRSEPMSIRPLRPLMQIITMQDSLSSTALQEAIEREKQVFRLSIDQVEANVAAFEKKFGTHDWTSLFEKAKKRRSLGCGLGCSAWRRSAWYDLDAQSRGERFLFLRGKVEFLSHVSFDETWVVNTADALKRVASA